MRKLTVTITLLSLAALFFVASSTNKIEAAQPDLSAIGPAACSAQSGAPMTEGRICQLRCGIDPDGGCVICCLKHGELVCK